MDTHIVLQVDDKPELIQFAQSKIPSGEQYAMDYRQILVEQYGASRKKIDYQSLIERVTGHLISCEMLGIELTPIT